MKVIASFAAFAVALTLVGSASAQQPTQRGQAQGQAQAQAQPAQVKTSDYTSEQSVGGDQVVKFTGDELAAPNGGYYGDTIRPLPGAIRVQLIRPRLNFVPELLKSVENL